MFNKIEIIGFGFCVALMALGLYLSQAQSIFFRAGTVGQTAQLTSTDTIVVNQLSNSNEERAEAYLKAVNSQGNFKRMVIDDIKTGVGEEVKSGDKVSVHYVGTLQSGEEFDNSRTRNQPFEFTVGKGQVIPGWEEGVVGMKVGGQRVLVIPPEKAYGSEGIGPIPGNATLVFAIELLEIK